MPNVLESATSLISTLIDNEPKPELHIGEAMGCWAYLTLLGEAMIGVDIGLNTTTDQELIEMLNDARKMCDSQIQRLKQFLIQEGVELPPLSEPRPKSEPVAVPAGVKLTDEEIANGLVAKMVTAIIDCATNTAQSVRSDVGVMWLQFQAEQVTGGATSKKVMKKRGWLKIPPAYRSPGIPNSII